eukprot:scaffold120285_cov28-Tisochrysis_lutea.AAC.2
MQRGELVGPPPSSTIAAQQDTHAAVASLHGAFPPPLPLLSFSSITVCSGKIHEISYFCHHIFLLKRTISLPLLSLALFFRDRSIYFVSSRQ